jgi:hypothetical protein
LRERLPALSFSALAELTYSAHTLLPDGSPLLAVVEVTRVRRWFRSVEVSETVSYVLRGGFWWGKRNERVDRRDPKHLRLCELAMQARVQDGIDSALG